MKTIRAVFFDLGNVVLRFDAEKLEKGLSSYGKIKDGKVIDYFLNSDNINRYMEGKLTSSKFYSRTCREFRVKIGFHDFYALWNGIFYPYPEVEEIIKTINDKYPDIKLILVSNTNESHFNFIKEEYKILELFDALVVSHEVGVQKPDPAIFKEALRISDTLPKDTFYTDDRSDLIAAARVLGLIAHQFTNHDSLRTQLSKYEIKV